MNIFLKQLIYSLDSLNKDKSSFGEVILNWKTKLPTLHQSKSNCFRQGKGME